MITLEPLTSALASRIEPWFDDPEVQHRLGGRFWIHRALRLNQESPGASFRGKVVLRSHSWVAHAAGTPVAFIGGDVYDRWTRYHGDTPDGEPILSEVDPRRSMGLSYVVDPARWRQGHGRATLHAAVTHPAVADVHAFYCGIDSDNHASQKCCEAAGFHLTNPEPDHEDTLYYRHHRGSP